jgi:hypothetical protein
VVKDGGVVGDVQAGVRYRGTGQRYGADRGTVQRRYSIVTGGKGVSVWRVA